MLIFHQTLSTDSPVVATGAVFRFEGDEKYETKRRDAANGERKMVKSSMRGSEGGTREEGVMEGGTEG